MMKPSPLQLNWITYPQAPFEALPSFDGDPSIPVTPRIEATVQYFLDGQHSASLEIRNSENAPGPYKFHVGVVTSFSFDLESAQSAYSTKKGGALSSVIGVNICRILYASARELLSNFTARAPHQSLTLASLIIEPSDVTFESKDDPFLVLKEVFSASDDEISSIEKAVKGTKGKPKRKA